MNQTAADDRLARLEQQNQSLQRSVRELSVLTQIAAASSTNESLDATIELIVHKCMECLDVQQGDIHLYQEQSETKPLRTVFREAHSSAEQSPYRLGEQLIGWMLKNQKPLLINDPAGDPRFRALRETDPSIRSLLSVPLRFRGKFLGILSAVNKKAAEGFSADDERLLCILASHSAPILHTVQLIGELRQERNQLAEENSQLWKEVRAEFSLKKILGSSAALNKVISLIEQIRDTSVDVLITGESGTGKELIAKTIHYSSPRARKPFVALNCAALPENLLESELFGIEKGVATGVERRLGQFETAHQGTIFLDEIGDLSLTAQAKILRVLQERQVQRLGGRQQIPIDVRVLAATNKDLADEIKAGRFREDLYYRLNVIHIKLPALRTIPDDIVQMAKYFLAEQCNHLNRRMLEFSNEALHCVQTAQWPGNVRQLQNEMKRLAICARGPVIEMDELSEAVRGERAAVELPIDDSGRPLDAALADYEKKLIIAALGENGNNQVRTAEALGLSRQGLIKKMKRLGVSSSGGDRDDSED